VDEGYLVLAGKERKESESAVIREVLEKRFKRQVDPIKLFSLHEKTSSVTRQVLQSVLNCNLPEFSHIVWTSQMRRLAVLIGTAMKFKEPILLVGETGCGKTTIVQLLSQLMNRKLYCVNCHMNSEGSDFLGGLRPVRDHTNKVIILKLNDYCKIMLSNLQLIIFML
jgi:midasin